LVGVASTAISSGGTSCETAATTAKWLATGAVVAVRSGAFSLSSIGVDPTGACSDVGWIINPYGHILARTTLDVPFATLDIDLPATAAAQDDYPRYVFSGDDSDRESSGSGHVIGDPIRFVAAGPDLRSSC
jgi:hypothetical protein